MAKVESPPRADVERELRIAAVNWAEVDEVRPHWRSLDVAEKEGYHQEWWVGAHHPTQRLRAWEREGLLDDEQRQRLAELQPLTERNEAFLAAVFAEK